MAFVTICVVSVIVGNIGGFVINRTNTDVERTIKEHFGPQLVFSKPMHHVSQIDPDIDSTEISIETEEVDSSGRDFEKSFKDFYGPPLLSKPHVSPMPKRERITKSNLKEKADKDVPQEELDSIFGAYMEPDANSSVLWPSTVSDYDTRRKNYTDLDVKVLNSIWGVSTPSEDQADEIIQLEESNYSPDAETLVLIKTDFKNDFGSPQVPSESMVAVTENYFMHNETRTPIIRVDEDRFLSEGLLRSIWLQNADEEKKSETTIMPRLARMPSENPDLEPEQRSIPSTDRLKPDLRTISHKDSLVPSSGNSALNKQISRSLFFIVPCLYLVYISDYINGLFKCV